MSLMCLIQPAYIEMKLTRQVRKQAEQQYLGETVVCKNVKSGWHVGTFGYDEKRISTPPQINKDMNN